MSEVTIDTESVFSQGKGNYGGGKFSRDREGKTLASFHFRDIIVPKFLNVDSSYRQCSLVSLLHLPPPPPPYTLRSMYHSEERKCIWASFVLKQSEKRIT